MVHESVFSPSTILVNLCSSSGRNLSCGVESPRGANPNNGIGSLLLSSRRNPINGVVKPGLLEGEIPALEFDVRVGDIP